MSVELKISELIEPSIVGMGYELVRVQYAAGTLQIMAEKSDESEMTVDDCAEISHTVSALLDVADPIKSQYVLEVSSPGMDRPLTRLSDYERFSGEPARIDMKAPVDGRKRFLGVLSGANGMMVRLQLEDGTLVELPFEGIHQARLDVSRTLDKPKAKPEKSGNAWEGKPVSGAKKKTAAAKAANANGTEKKTGPKTSRKKSNGEV